MNKKLIFGLISCVIIGLVCVGLAELGLRVGGFAPSESAVTVTTSEFERVPGLFKPGQDVLDRSKPALEHRVHINNLGFRGDDFPLEKGKGEIRILFVGDSFIYGDYVDDEYTMPAQFEQALHQVCSDASVVNAGVGGTTIRDYIKVLERAMVLKPDLVILGFTENDVQDMIGTSAWDIFASNREAKSRFPLNMVYPVLRHSALWHLALRAKAVWSSNRNLRELHAADVSSSAVTTEELRSRYAEYLAELQKTLWKEGVPLFFSISPTHLTLEGSKSREQLDWIVGLADSLGIERLDLSGAFLGSGLQIEEMFLLPHDGHPSPAGHRLAADAILDALRERSMLPCS